MDSDYSVCSILPPDNTIEANLIVGGKLESTSQLSPAAVWNVDANQTVIGPDNVSVLVANPGGVRCYR